MSHALMTLKVSTQCLSPQQCSQSVRGGWKMVGWEWGCEGCNPVSDNIAAKKSFL